MIVNEEIKRIKREVVDISFKMLFGKTLEEVMDEIWVKVMNEEEGEEKVETLDR